MTLISLCPLTVLPCSPLDQIDAAASAGYDAIGLRLARSLPTDVDVLGDRGLCAAIERRLYETGIRVFDIEVARVVPSSDLDDITPLFAFGARLGARYIQVTGGPGVDWEPGDDDALVPKIRDLADRAADFGMSLALEFIVFRSLRSLSHALNLRDRCGRDNVRVTLDALHFMRSGGTLEELAASDLAAFACFHISDAPAMPSHDLAHEARYGRMMPGAGGLPLVELLTILPEDLPIGIEVPDLSQDSTTPAQKAMAALEASKKVIAMARR